MTLIAEFDIPLEEFALEETLTERPDLEFEIDRVVAQEGPQVVPFVRVAHGDLEGLTEILKADPSVEDIDLLSKNDEERFYRMMWTDKTQVIWYMIQEQDATIQQATASSGQWHLRVLFPERRNLAATNDYAQANQFRLDINRIYSIDDLELARYNLTKGQHEALTVALEEGYFGVPRGINQSDLATKLDISHQALSERLRRATGSLVTATLDSEMDEDESA